MAKTKSNKGGKPNDPAELTLQILTTDYKTLKEKLNEQLGMIHNLPDGYERRFLQEEYDEFVTLYDNHSSFKKIILQNMGIEEDSDAYIMSPELLADLERRLRGKVLHTNQDQDAPPGEGL